VQSLFFLSDENRESSVVSGELGVCRLPSALCRLPFHDLWQMHTEPIEIYSDGSCHTESRIGGWAAVLFIGQKKVILTGKESNTTHNQMELTAVIKAIEYIQANNPSLKNIRICSDSQYVIGLQARKQKLTTNKFITRRGSTIPNAELVADLFKLIQSFNVEWNKIKAHQKKNETVNPNIEVDKLSRKIVREEVQRGTGY
jgi:ribonuclease HI